MATKPVRIALASVLCVGLALTGLVTAATWIVSSPAAGPTSSASTERLMEDLPLYFIENQGQTDPQVSHYVQGQDTSIYFTDGGLTFAMADRAGEPDLTREDLTLSAQGNEASRWVVKMDFVGAREGVPAVGTTRTPAVVSYFTGSPEKWRTAIPTYSQLVYSQLWEGIDLVYSGTVNRLKYQFELEPGADPERIGIAYRGATSVLLNQAGQLQVTTPAGGFTDDAPTAYQLVDGLRVDVPVSYALEPGQGGVRSYGFRLGAYDRTRPLVLDPAMLVYAGYIGGFETDAARDIAVDNSGAVYITGQTNSTEATFPSTVGPDVTFNGSRDAFVAKVNPAGTGLVYAGYIGGSAIDLGTGIAVDGTGNAYVTGLTISTQATFPVTVGPDLTFNGVQDAFVAKVNPAGTGLVYAGYIGGSGTENGGGIAVDGAGEAYVGGNTNSTQATFPEAIGPDLTFNGGIGGDAFVAKVNAAGTGLVYAGYIGGSTTDAANAIALDGAGAAHLTGSTNSTEATFPEAVGPDLTYNGSTDGFLAKVNAAGTGLVYAGYVGGSGVEAGRRVAVDSVGAGYVTGNTTSTESSFPVAVGPDLTHNGGEDAFVVKVNAAGTGFSYAGYIGGAALDRGEGIAVDGTGAAYVAGVTVSTEATFPVTGGPDLTFNGSSDAFVAKLDPAGTGLVYAGYIGGSSGDAGFGIALDATRAAYVTGDTGSTQATFPDMVGPDLTHNGNQDAFVAKVVDVVVPATVTLDPPTDVNPVGTDHTVTATVEDALGNPVSGVVVRFSVQGSVSASGSCTTDANGQCSFTYQGPTQPGVDTITAFADTNADGDQDIGEPSATASKTWVPGDPATVTVEPPTATNPVDTQHCVTATVEDAFGNPVPGVTVQFTVTGSVTTSGSATTDAQGQAQFCYTGPPFPGADAITAFADTNGDGDQDAGEPSGAATKTWVLPVSTPGCEVTISDGGQITAANGDKATFGGHALVSSSGQKVKGVQEYQDHGPAQPMNVHSRNVLAVVCSADRTEATIFGKARINGSGSFDYRIRVKDAGEPGTNDQYGILLSSGYFSGDQTLEGGNVQITVHEG